MGFVQVACDHQPAASEAGQHAHPVAAVARTVPLQIACDHLAHRMPRAPAAMAVGAVLTRVAHMRADAHHRSGTPRLRGATRARVFALDL